VHKFLKTGRGDFMIMYAFRQGTKSLNNDSNMTTEPFILKKKLESTQILFVRLVWYVNVNLLKIFENEVERKIFEHKEDEVSK
jgi:hypothetical protein